jgi:hypothetical protein
VLSMKLKEVDIHKLVETFMNKSKESLANYLCTY